MKNTEIIFKNNTDPISHFTPVPVLEIGEHAE